MKFKIGDKVKVIRKSTGGEIHWNSLMNKAIGKTYTVLAISRSGNLRLNTELDTEYNFLYPPKGVITNEPNEQLVFDFTD